MEIYQEDKQTLLEDSWRTFEKLLESECMVVPDSYGLPGRTKTEQTYKIFGLC